MTTTTTPTAAAWRERTEALERQRQALLHLPEAEQVTWCAFIAAEVDNATARMPVGGVPAQRVSAGHSTIRIEEAK